MSKKLRDIRQKLKNISTSILKNIHFKTINIPKFNPSSGSEATKMTNLFGFISATYIHKASVRKTKKSLESPKLKFKYETVLTNKATLNITDNHYYKKKKSF